MNLVAYSILIPNPYMFCCYFISLRNGVKLYTYKDRESEENYNKLITTINTYKLIGIDNKNYDDVIMNYIYANKEINTEEIYALSDALIDIKNKGHEIKSYPDVDFYRSRFVTSEDLYMLNATQANLNKNGVISSIPDLLLTCYDNTSIVESEFKRLKKRINNGFTSGLDMRTISERIKDNYIADALCLR